MSSDDLLLGGLILLAALLYASVGHGGASGYLAAMALVGVVPEVMKPTALALNVVVALVATIKFHRAGAFSWPVFWPFALGAIPMAYLGGSLTLPGAIYKPLVGVVLIFAAWRSLRTAAQASYELAALPPMALRLGIGAALGLLSGLTGVGGGIFLSPLLMIFRWGAFTDNLGHRVHVHFGEFHRGVARVVHPLAAVPLGPALVGTGRLDRRLCRCRIR
jgi:uncharacterized membrane protein YfcA